MNMDLLITNAKLVLDNQVVTGGIGIDGGQIHQLGDVQGNAAQTIDAGGLHVLPGVIDAHVHFNDPGRAGWESIETGSRALAAGGGTCFIDMPLNASPPTLDAESFDKKLAVAQKTSLTDFAFWGGLTPINLDKMKELAGRGVVGFKAFMADSGIDDFPRADDATLEKGMRIAAGLGLPVAVHAEDNATIAERTRQAISRGGKSVREFLACRPIEAELRAIDTACELARQTKCSLHIVHVSSGSGVALVLEKQKSGVAVTCETCPHYLLFTEEDMSRIGAAAKCAPPMHNEQERGSLWQHLLAGDINFVASDHSPSPISMKQGDNFFKVWGGIAGVQSMLSAMLVEGHQHRGMPLPTIANLLSRNVARRFKLPRKGEIKIGNDADLVLVDLQSARPLRADELHDRHKLSPYVGLPISGIVRRTLLRGQTIYHDGQFANPTGQLLAHRPMPPFPDRENSLDHLHFP